VIVPAVANKNEHFEVRCILTYDSKGSKLQMQNEMMMKGNTTSLDIMI
jgi:hypothetical protein